MEGRCAAAMMKRSRTKRMKRMTHGGGSSGGGNVFRIGKCGCGRETHRTHFLVRAEGSATGGEGATSSVKVSVSEPSPAVGEVENGFLDDSKPERQAERFMVLDLGEADCSKCGYHYEPKKGDPEYPIASGTLFSNLPEDWICPLCGAEKMSFQASSKEIAGFAENQNYGFGTNSMTAGEKNLLIYGSLGFFFALFLAGYFLE